MPWMLCLADSMEESQSLQIRLRGSSMTSHKRGFVEPQRAAMRGPQTEGLQHLIGRSTGARQGDSAMRLSSNGYKGSTVMPRIYWNQIYICLS